LITYRIRLAGNDCCRVSNVKRVKILLRLNSSGAGCQNKAYRD
jgi:hypothetical protein